MTNKEHINDSLKNSDKNFNENCTRDKKQIIVDGVDVKNCKGIDLSLSPLVKCKSLKFKTSDGGIAGIWCSDHTNCYFKQLARKTQECEALKKRNEDNERFYLKQYAKKDSEVLDLTHKLNVKTQECEIWKNQVLILDEEDVTVQVTQEQFEEYQKLRQQCKQLKEDYVELERECERLKSYGATLLADKNAMEIGRDDYLQRCKQLEQECEELKEQLT